MKIIVELTLAEAKALSQAVGNSLVTEEDAMDILATKTAVKAAFRASSKLDKAIYDAQNRTASK